MKLREEVKKGLVIGFCLIIIIVLSISIEVSTNKAIERCIANGQSKNICESGLR